MNTDTLFERTTYQVHLNPSNTSLTEPSSNRSQFSIRKEMLPEDECFFVELEKKKLLMYAPLSRMTFSIKQLYCVFLSECVTDS